MFLIPRPQKVVYVIIIIFFFFIIFPKEAEVSQVSFEFIDTPLQEYIDQLSEDDHILIVKDLVSSKWLLKVNLPKKTHFEKKEESIYSEDVNEFEVIDVIKSKHFKKGDRIWSWDEPAYNFRAIKLYHEEGVLGSPILLRRKEKYPNHGTTMIIFARKLDREDNESFEPYKAIVNPEVTDIFSFYVKEGLQAEKEIRQYLKRKEGMVISE
jgi:hypothetical protein